MSGADERDTAASTSGRIGCVLAAGAGTRWGYPKILHPGWLDHAVTALRPYCGTVLVVTGAARSPLPAGTTEVHCPDWWTGLSASFRAGVTAADAVRAANQLVLMPVDTPGVTAAAVGRTLDGVTEDASRAVYRGHPGHPVVLPRRLWRRAVALAEGDSGARPLLQALLRTGELRLVECGEISDGKDFDEPSELRDHCRRE